MSKNFTMIPGGTVTSPRGFQAGGVCAGIRTEADHFDLGLLYSEVLCTAAAVYTSNHVKAAPILVSQEHIKSGKAQVIIANSGCANAATGDRGLRDARAMAKLAAAALSVEDSDVLVASTGVIGTYLPMEGLAESISSIKLSPKGGSDFASAIMTTDSRPKYVGAHFRCDNQDYTLGGVAKGAGMIHPNMATMLCFLTTDAPIEKAFLAESLQIAVESTFNMIDVDSDTSTNDTVTILANGLAGGSLINSKNPAAASFCAALTAVCSNLAKTIVEDAEGATKVIEVSIDGAASLKEARTVALEVVRSLGVKTAIYGHDPNWGRILAAIGNSGITMEEKVTSIWLADQCLFRGEPQSFDVASAKVHLAGRNVDIRIHLGIGDGQAVALGSDITEEYIRLNSQYTT